MNALRRLSVVENRCSAARIHVPRPFEVPRVICSPCGIEVHSWPFVSEHHTGVSGRPAAPFPEFRMTVGESEPTSAIVIACWNILPMVHGRNLDELSVVDRVWMLIDE